MSTASISTSGDPIRRGRGGSAGRLPPAAGVEAGLQGRPGKALTAAELEELDLAEGLGAAFEVAAEEQEKAAMPRRLPFEQLGLEIGRPDPELLNPGDEQAGRGHLVARPAGGVDDRARRERDPQVVEQANRVGGELPQLVDDHRQTGDAKEATALRDQEMDV
jgi:hypothetical protein